jgi:hypothetical protein
MNRLEVEGTAGVGPAAITVSKKIESANGIPTFHELQEGLKADTKVKGRVKKVGPNVGASVGVKGTGVITLRQVIDWIRGKPNAEKGGKTASKGLSYSGNCGRVGQGDRPADTCL